MPTIKIVNDELLNHIGNTKNEVYYGRDIQYMSLGFAKQNLMRVIKMGILELEPDFLRVNNIEDNTIAEITSAHKETKPEDSKYGKKQIVLPVRIRDERFLWNLNKTTQKNLVKAWGNNTDLWVGKKVVISVQQQNVRGKLQPVLYGTPYPDGVK